MTYKAGDQVRDEFNVPIHKLIFQKIKKTCEFGKPGWIILDENKNEFTSCFIYKSTENPIRRNNNIPCYVVGWG